MKTYFRPWGLVGAALLGGGTDMAIFSMIVTEPLGVIWGTAAVILGAVMMWASVERRAA